MKFTTTTKDLKKACALLKAAIPSKSTKKIFECMKIESLLDSETIRLSATDLQFSVFVDLPVTAKEGSGDYAVPFAQIQKLAAQKNADTLTFVGGEDTAMGPTLVATWKGKRTDNRRTIAGEKVEQYPALVPPTSGGVDFVGVEGLGLSLLEAKTFTGKEAARFVLNGIKLTNKAVVACDGRRLYMRELPSLPECGIIGIPKLAVAAMKTINAVRTVSDGRQVQLMGDGFVIGIRVMEGTFPSYSQIIPRGNLFSMDIDPEAWTEGIDAVKDCVSVSAQAVQITADPTAVVFTAKGGDAGGEATIEQDTGTLGDGSWKPEDGNGNQPTNPRRFGLNPDFLIDALKLGVHKVSGSDAKAAYRFDAPEGRTIVIMPILID